MKKICYVVTVAVTIRAFFIKQLKFLAQNGFEVTVICSPDDKLQENLGENIRYIPVTIERGVKPTTLKGTISRLKTVFSQEKFDMVQYSTPNAAFCASIAARLAGVPVRNYHMMGLRYQGMQGIKRFFFKMLERFTCMLSTDIECITKSNLELCVKNHLFKRQKATIVGGGSTGGVDLARFDYRKRSYLRAETRLELGIEENEFLFGFVGRITRDKGVNEMLTAFSKLKRDCKLLIIGDKEGIDTLDQNLWHNAEENGNIIILKSTDEIEKYYSAIDVLLLPTYREGFGMVIAEAAAMGTPAIVSNVPGPVDVIADGITALSVNVRDAEDLRYKMEYIMDTPQLIEAMAQKGIEFASKNFDSDMLCGKILERKQYLLAD